MKGKIFYNETTVLFIYICYVLFKNRNYSSILNVSFLNKILYFYCLLRQQNKTWNVNALWKNAIEITIE